MKATDRGAVVDRNRTFFTSAIGLTVKQDAVLNPWECGWESPCVLVGNQMVPKVKMPWLRTRGVSDEAGGIVYTYGAYSPWNMLYRANFFGGSQQLAELTTTQPPILWLDWKKLLGEEGFQALNVLLEHEKQAVKTGRFFPTKEKVKELDRCAICIARALNSCDDPPVRLPSIKEKLIESELESYFEGIDVTRVLLTEETLSNLIGNFFKPSIVCAAIQGQDEQACKQFLEGQYDRLVIPQVPSLARIHSAYKEIVDITARYVNVEFPSVINKIQEYWAPTGRRINQNWLDKLGKLGPTPLDYKPRVMKITPQQVQALLAPKRHEVDQPERAVKEQPFPAWLARCLVKAKGDAQKQMKENGHRAGEIVEAFRETHLVSTIQNAPPTHMQRTLLEEIENTKHPLEAVAAYEKLAQITPGVRETLVLHIQGIGTHHTLISSAPTRANMFVITVTPDTIFFTFSAEEAYSERQYRELMQYLGAASKICQGMGSQLLGAESQWGEFLQAKLNNGQALAVKWKDDGTLCIVCQQVHWYLRGTLAETVVSGYGLLNTCSLYSPLEPQAGDDIVAVLPLLRAIDQKLQVCTSTAPNPDTAKITYQVLGQSEPVACREYPTYRKDAAMQGVTLVIDTDNRVAFWVIGGPPPSDPHGIT